MKAAAVRRVAERYSTAELSDAIRAAVEEEREILDVDGEDAGERLTHLLLAQRIRARMDAGEDLKEAFRTEMGSVRETLTNG